LLRYASLNCCKDRCPIHRSGRKATIGLFRLIGGELCGISARLVFKALAGRGPLKQAAMPCIWAGTVARFITGSDGVGLSPRLDGRIPVEELAAQELWICRGAQGAAPKLAPMF